MTEPIILLFTPDVLAQGGIEQALGDSLGLRVEKRGDWREGDSSDTQAGRHPALIILDAQLPGHGAIRFLEVLKKDAAHRKIPIMIIAPPGRNSVAIECLKLGAKAVLETPVNTDELIGTIWWLLRDILLPHMRKRDINHEAAQTPAPPAPPEPAATPGPAAPVPASPRSTPPPFPPPQTPLPDTEKDTRPARDPLRKSPSSVPPAAPSSSPSSQASRVSSSPCELAVEKDEGPRARFRLFGYEIEDIIGSGGMATVYRARQTSLQRPVAIKVISRDLAESPEFSTRFIREARVQASLSHPHIAHVFDLGSSGPLLYIVMELVEGEALSKWIEHKRLRPVHWMYVAHVMGEVLAYLHTRDIIHRDVKPANLLIGRNGAVKLTDFGITYCPEPDLVERLTLGRRSLGTPFFMSPEQVDNPIAADSRSDIYSLAVMLHVMLVGGMTAHPLPFVHQYLPHLPPEVDAAFRPALARDPQKRPADVRQITEPFIAALLPLVEPASQDRLTRDDLYTCNPFLPLSRSNSAANNS